MPHREGRRVFANDCARARSQRPPTGRNCRPVENNAVGQSTTGQIDLRITDVHDFDELEIIGRIEAGRQLSRRGIERVVMDF